MKKVYVKWGFTDDYGRACEKDAVLHWFETEEQAEQFIAKMRSGNGGYFKLWKMTKGDYDKYLRLQQLLVEVEQLKKEFE